MSTPPAPPSPSSPVESPAATQARLRRERREAKIKAGGSARLDKITQLSGRPAEPAPAATLTSAFAPPADDDPAEVDISQHAYAGAAGFGADNGAQMRGMGRGGRGGARGGVQPGGGLGEGPGGEDDPMVRMLRQMVGGMAPGGGGGEGLPEGLAAMLGGGGMEQGRKEEEEEGNGAWWWRAGHAGLALALGVYVTSGTGFSGSRVGRVGFGDEDGLGVGVRFFWVFITAELVLQSTRYFVERGRFRGGRGGVMGMVMGVLPEPWKGYLGLVRRYGGIWTTVVEDAMVVVFVLGVKAWWKGGPVG